MLVLHVEVVHTRTHSNVFDAECPCRSAWRTAYIRQVHIRRLGGTKPGSMWDTEAPL